MPIHIANILKNKNFIAISISLMVHSLIFVSMEIYTANDNKYSVVPVKLVMMQLPKAKENTEKEKTVEHKLIKQNISNVLSKEKFSNKDVVSKAKPSNNHGIAKISKNIKNTNDADVYNKEMDGLEATSHNENFGSTVSRREEIGSEKIKELDKVIVSHREIPRYPVFSRRMHEEGTVLLLLTVKNGAVCEVSVEKSSGFPRLDSAAQEAAKKWRFSNEENFMVKIPFSFKLSN